MQGFWRERNKGYVSPMMLCMLILCWMQRKLFSSSNKKARLKRAGLFHESDFGCYPKMTANA
jgi:hypothetical protein